MTDTMLKIIKRIDEIIEEDEKKGWEWSGAAKKMAKRKAALNWARSRCLGSEWERIPEEEYDEAVIECIAINAVAYAKKFGERWGLIKYKGKLGE